MYEVCSSDGRKQTCLQLEDYEVTDHEGEEFYSAVRSNVLVGVNPAEIRQGFPYEDLVNMQDGEFLRIDVKDEKGVYVEVTYLED